MITLSNGHTLEFVTASGAMAYDGCGWWFEQPLRWAGLVRPWLFTHFMKTVTRNPMRGNLRWYWPWGCVRHIENGTVNKVGLTNPGIDYWASKYGPKMDCPKPILAGSMAGTVTELVKMAMIMDEFDLVALEVNPSCPNTGQDLSHDNTKFAVEAVKAVKNVTRHPVIVKVSVAQNYCAISEQLKGVAEAISLNSVPWEMVFPNRRSPLHRLQEKVGGGGGGVSGKVAQAFTWHAAFELIHRTHALPVIVPSVWEYDDIDRIYGRFGERRVAVSFGSIHIPQLLNPLTWLNPAKPTRFVRRWRAENQTR